MNQNANFLTFNSIITFNVKLFHYHFVQKEVIIQNVKHKRMKYCYIGFLSFIFSLFSCSSLVTLNVKMLEPGAISLGPDIGTVALVNRALPGPTTKTKNVIDILTSESLNHDLQGRQQILEGLNNALMQSPRLKGFLATAQYSGDMTGTLFPAPMSWDTINQICMDNHTDAVIALETFHTDVTVTHETGNIQMTNQFGISIPTVQISATQKVLVKIGFRIYNPKTQKIVDQYTYSYWRTWGTQATSIGEAIAALESRQLCVNQACNTAGGLYENRISPTWNYEQRSLWKKAGRSPMAVGSRMAIVGNWDEAAKNWNQVLASSTKRKLCGRAAYNLALASEVNGDLLAAKNYISQAYGQYNNKQAQYYQNTINRRYNDMIRLNQQFMENNTDSTNTNK